MLPFYTMESVRDQIKGALTVRTINIPHNWNRYPCDIEKQCEAKGTLTCDGYVEIDVGSPHFSRVVLEIVFFRPRRMALIRKENSQLQKLIRLSIVDTSKLVPVI